MAQSIVIDPITRIEGHGKITIELDGAGKVTDARFQVTQFRGFEKFCEGRPFYEMPSLVERICGICPVSHSLASAKACDGILGTRVPEAGAALRRLLSSAQMIQSHALSFFHLSSPDLLLGMDADPSKRNLLGLLAAHPEVARDGIRLRQIGQSMIEALAGKRIHPAWVVPGGVATPLDEEKRQMMLTWIPEGLEITLRTIAMFKRRFDHLKDEIRSFANFPSLFLGMVTADGTLEHVDGWLRFVDARGQVVVDRVEPERYGEFMAEAVEPWSYLKSPYFRPMGYPEGIYRVGPAARLNVCNGCGTPLADEEWAEYRSLERGPVLSAFFNHYARLIEILYALETAERLLKDPIIVDRRIRAHAQPNFSEGVGIVEAPRGSLIHHYRVDEQGLMIWANLIVATGHNNLAMNKGVRQVARSTILNGDVTEGALNRLEAVIRAFDPCLSCSTHAWDRPWATVQVVGPDGRTVYEGSR
ncbi:MAG: Ni/Fe hydrogenase subunit alpha [Desulfobacterales bacterium]